MEDPSRAFEDLLRQYFCAQCGSLQYCGDKHRARCVGCGLKQGRTRQEHKPIFQVQPLTEPARELSRFHAPETENAEDEAGGDAVIEEQCPKCGHNKLSYRTAQLRSVDEGQTIFYTCLKCKHRFTVNS
ncbi:DNA-directed RNA polymerase I subunit RPA12 [Porphyridium purpureum]|uniref:DNA-directed RNA polymerase subunit n=1 Tax=Porphyridium purpureum TaxID=35688 RepID=A0A5J4YNE4_PORPP|nr:DNA-directed RNA polymerase I subunit RPA12 [Porphyridium purpureum]|eukprot:POR9700..scf222_8